ncbi:MAG: polysaccharide biosynthesis tyrosine autokinase [Chloroflexi bacterium]|nr:polysaccharide biosynthesis tyrosine autokinase [Chloroflexota bacterium]
MEFRRFQAIVWKWLWLVILGTAVVTLTTYWISVTSTPIYRASATLLVEAGLPEPKDEAAALLTIDRVARTYIQLISSPDLMEEVISGLGLDFSPTALASKISGSPVPSTQLFQIQIEDSNPLRAREIANRVAESFVKRNTRMRQSRFDAAKAELDEQIGNVEKEIERVQGAINSLGDPKDPKNLALPDFVRAEQGRLQASLSKNQIIYSTLLQSAHDLRLSTARYANNVSISTRAEVPPSPIKPRVFFNTVLAALLGFLASLGLAFFLEFLDDTIKSVEDISQFLGLASLGAIFRITGKKIEDKLVTRLHARSPITEAYRGLRTSLQFTSVDRPLRSLLVTSASPMEGKSTTVANLGIVMAQGGKSIVIVDSDLRRPIMHRFFQLPNTQGLTTLLVEDNPIIDGILQATEIDNLRVLTSGPLPPNPAELLGSQRMKEVLEELKRKADIVLFDSPPTLAVTDASVLAGQVDGTMLVVDAGNTRRGAAQRAKEQLVKVGANLIGSALNKLSSRGGAGYYYYYYYYYSEDGERRGRRSRRKALGRLRVAGASLAALVLLGGGFTLWSPLSTNLLLKNAVEVIKHLLTRP